MKERLPGREAVFACVRDGLARWLEEIWAPGESEYELGLGRTICFTGAMDWGWADKEVQRDGVFHRLIR